MIREKLMEKFGNNINHHSLVYQKDGEANFRSLLKKCDTIIEIGTYQGVSSAILSEYADKVFTIDIIFLPMRMKIHRHLELDNVWATIVKSNDHKKEFVEELIEAEKVDLCFIDGEHFKGGVAFDFDICKKCDTILFHDYSPDFIQVYDFCNNLEGYDKEIKGTFMLCTKQKDFKPVEKRKKVSQTGETILGKKRKTRKKKDGMSE